MVRGSESAAAAGPAPLIWLTGLSSAGKTTIARIVSGMLRGGGFDVQWLDGDMMRERLGRELGFDKTGRDENVGRIAYVAALLNRHGVIVVVSAIAPYREIRDEIRGSSPAFIEVYVKASLATCERRDVKGLYRRARAGAIRQFTGVDDPYEPPLAPEVECDTERDTASACAQKVVDTVMEMVSRGRASRACAPCGSAAPPAGGPEMHDGSIEACRRPSA